MNKAWLKAAKAGDVSAMKALADHYEEQGDKLSAAQWRSKAGLSRVIYQVYNTESGKVEREYNRMAHAEGWFARFRDYKERSIRKIRVMEYIEQVVVDINPEARSAYWTGPVTIRAGEFSGKTGVVVGYTARRHERGYSYDARVLIEGVEHLIPKSDVKFLP